MKATKMLIELIRENGFEEEALEYFDGSFKKVSFHSLCNFCWNHDMFISLAVYEQGLEEARFDLIGQVYKYDLEDKAEEMLGTMWFTASFEALADLCYELDL